MKIKLTDEQIQLILASSNRHITMVHDYYFIPYVFKKDITTDEWEVVHMSKINDVVTKILTK